MKSSRGARLITTLATIVLLVALALGLALAAVWSSLPLDHTTVIIDGETLVLPNLSGWQAALALLLAVLAVLVAAIVAVGAVAIGLATTLFGVAIVVLAVLLTLLLLASPLLLVCWLIWRLARSASGTGGARPELA